MLIEENINLKTHTMKTIADNQKNNLEKLSKVLEIGALSSLGFTTNGVWVAQYTSDDYVAKQDNNWFPMHNCFRKSFIFQLLSS